MYSWNKCRTAPRLAVFAIIHSVVKKRKFCSRRQAVVEFLSKYIPVAGNKGDDDVQIGGRLRPVDLLITRGTGGRPLAGDVVVTHPVAPSLGLSSATTAAAVRNMLLGNR